MSALAPLLAGDRAPGVYRWPDATPAAEVTSAATAAGWGCVVLDATAGSRGEALTAIGEALSFPAHYGRNLDALWDCLRDIPTPMLLVWESWAGLADADRGFFDRLVRVLADRAAAGGFAVLLPGDGPEVGAPALRDEA